MNTPQRWILLRGLMRDSRHWDHFPELLRRSMPDAEVLTLDLPGNGSRHRERSPASVEAMATHCRQELLRSGPPPPYRVLAMSLGAMVTVAWAALHPREQDACVLINTSLRPFSPFYRRLRPAAYPTLLRMALGNPSDRDCESAILRLTSNHNEADAPLLDDWTAWRRERPVSRGNALRQLWAAARFRAPRTAPVCPTLLLTSTHDALVDTDCSRRLARAWGCDLVAHPTAGHDLPLDDGAWVARQVRMWSDRIMTPETTGAVQAV